MLAVMAVENTWAAGFIASFLSPKNQAVMLCSNEPSSIVCSAVWKGVQGNPLNTSLITYMSLIREMVALDLYRICDY